MPTTLVQPGRVQLGGSLVVLGGTALAGSLTQQTFRQALVARLESIAELGAIVGTAIYPGALPETHDLDRDGPALTYTVLSLPRNHNLSGSDGTATARVQLGAWSHQIGVSDSITLAIFNAIDGAINDGSWGNGTVLVRSCLQDDEVDQPAPPREGSDEWIYQIASPYVIKHTVVFPTLS